MATEQVEYTALRKTAQRESTGDVVGTEDETEVDDDGRGLDEGGDKQA